jgi:hypothetical protein
MPATEATKTVVREFGGMVSDADPADIRPGQSRVQVNAKAQRPGELRPRLGWARVKFED